LLNEYSDARLFDNYDVYDCLLNYWNEKLQDDVFVIKNYGYEAGREIEFEYEIKKGVENKNKIKSFNGGIIPKEIIENEYFTAELNEIDKLIESSEIISLELSEMIEEESREDGLLNEVLNDKGDNISKKNLNSRMKEIKNKKSAKEEYEALCKYFEKQNEKDSIDKKVKVLRKELDDKVCEKYSKLSIEEVKHLLFDLKWMSKIENDINELVEQSLNNLSSRVVMIAKRYEYTLKDIEHETDNSRKAVVVALERMGYKW
ncbi:MAG: N-6 DNA methylase, partial [Bacilli bacterium]|nr:N-6 DNA methylase [Bacilli bacterium]